MPVAGAGTSFSALELDSPAVAAGGLTIAPVLEAVPTHGENFVTATSAIDVAIPTVQSSGSASASKPPIGLMDQYRNATPGMDDLILLAIDRIESHSHEDHLVSDWTDNIEHRGDLESQGQIDESLAIALAAWQ